MINTISKLGPRIGAFIIDTIFLGIFGQIIGIFFYKYLATIDYQGILIGLFISIIYFTIGYSRLTNGQTFGKKLVKIKVVNNKNECLNISQATLRATILFVPYFMMNYPLTFLSHRPDIHYIKTVFLLLLIISIVLLPFINRSSRQSLHDLLAGSFVVRKNAEAHTVIKSMKSSFYYIYSGSICLLLLAYILFIPKGYGDSSSNMSTLETISEKLKLLPDVINSRISDNTRTMYIRDSVSSIRYLEAELKVSFKPSGKNDDKTTHLFDTAAQVILYNHDSICKFDIIRIKLTYGFSMGIASRRYSYYGGKTPFEWQYPDSVMPSTTKTEQDIAETVVAKNESQGVLKIVRTKHRNGKLATEEPYVDGKLHGIYRSWYKNGLLETTIEYKNGKRHGITTTYYPNGQKESELLHEDDIFIKILTKWDEKGNRLHIPIE